MERTYTSTLSLEVEAVLLKYGFTLNFLFVEIVYIYIFLCCDRIVNIRAWGFHT